MVVRIKLLRVHNKIIYNLNSRPLTMGRFVNGVGVA